MAKPKITKPNASTFWPLPLLDGRVLSRIGRNRMVTDGIRNRNCHAMELSMPAANTPMDAESWYAAVNRPKKMTFKSLRRYLVATTRKAEPATCSPAVCSTRAMITVHRFAAKK